MTNLTSSIQVSEEMRLYARQTSDMASEMSNSELDAIYLAMRSKDHSIAVDDVERVAKAICAVATDEDPDEIILPGTPRWVAYIPEADAAITAIGSQSK